jgi:hypothetical protein
MLIVSTSDQVTGVANAGSELYVRVSSTNRIRVYDSQTLAELRSWSSDRPKQIAVDTQSNLWILQATDASNPPKILHYSKTGSLSSQKITDIVDPTAVAINPQGRLLVTENGPRQQVLIYDISGTPKLIGTFGTQGGIYSGTRGEVGELKLNGLTGVGTDKAGNIYVSNDGFGSSGTDLRKSSPLGKMQWQLLGLQFVDNADADQVLTDWMCSPNMNISGWTIVNRMDRNGLTKAIPSINFATLTIRDCTTKTIRRPLFLSVELKLNVSYISQECLPISSVCTVLMEKLQFPVPSLRGIILPALLN